MKIALLADVHANLPALEAVLSHAQQREVDAIWNLGDLVGYGGSPDEVVRRLAEEEVVNIAGNYDLKVLAFKEKQGRWRKKKQALKFLGFQWTDNVLSDRNRQYLRSLPLERELQIAGWRLLLTHGSPASEEEHLTCDTSEERLRTLSSMVDVDVILCGHSHQAFARDVDGVQVINPGSVGRPDDGDPRASYAVLQIGPASGRNLTVQHERIAYDVERAVAALRNQGLPESFAQMVTLGRPLDDVMAMPGSWDKPAPASLGWSEVEVDRRLEAVVDLAESCDYEVTHTRHVTSLSLRLFDELQPLHQLGAEDRFWLRCGAMLHDIGWVEGRKAHHKTSLRLILDSLGSPFDDRERQLIGSIARYHRRALPKQKHDHLTALSPLDQYRATVLAGLLRIGDGLDRTHRGVVQDLSCEVRPRQIVVCSDVGLYPIPERDSALDKGDLLERCFNKELVIDWRPV